MKELKLTKGFIALVDDEDYPKLCDIAWFVQKHKMPNGYSYYGVAGFPDNTKKSKQKKIRLHRYIMGVTDRQIQIDHKNGNTLDCQKDNLRLATHGQNQQNKVKSPNKASRFKGVVRYNTIKNPWRAQIKPNKQLIVLGKYPTEEQAAIAYNCAAQKYFGEFARLNNIMQHY